MRSDLTLSEQRKQQIAQQFGQAAAVYNTQAKLQYQGAQRLLNLIQVHRSLIPPGDVLEIGCGTGFITQGLVQNFPDRSLNITDLSSEMLEFCQKNLIIPPAQLSRILFCQLDAESHQIRYRKYASVVSGFVIQWFTDPDKTLAQIIEQLHPDGILFLSFPGSQSFPEWRKICRQLDLPCTANSLPDLELLLTQLAGRVRPLHVETLNPVTHHLSAADFFRSFKQIGAGVSQRQLSVRQMKQLIRSWDDEAGDQIIVHHEIIYCVLQRIS